MTFEIAVFGKHNVPQNPYLILSSFIKFFTEIFNGDIVETIPGGVQPPPQRRTGALVGTPTITDAKGVTRTSPSLSSSSPPSIPTKTTESSAFDESKPFHFSEPVEQAGGGATGQDANSSNVAATNTATTPKEPIISSAETSAAAAAAETPPSSYSPSGFEKVLENRGNPQSNVMSGGGPTSYSPSPTPRTTAGTPNASIATTRPPVGSSVEQQTPTYSAAAFAKILQNREAIRGANNSSGGAGGTPPFPSSPAAAVAASAPMASTPAAAAPMASTPTSPAINGIHHASRSDFDIDRLQSKGPRKNADVGTPHDSTKLLMKGSEPSMGNKFSAGSWWCDVGGWPSLTMRTSTEIFYVFDGHGCVTDLDNTRHYFGPGDTVILPKGWSGRWDVLEPIHKVWFVHDHPEIEEPLIPSSPIRATVIHYQDLIPSKLFDVQQSHTSIKSNGLHGTPIITSSRPVYGGGEDGNTDDVAKMKSTNVGFWTCTTGSFPITMSQTTFFHLLEGVIYLTNPATGTIEKRCVAGDTVVLTKGWTGLFEIIEPAKKLWVTV